MKVANILCKLGIHKYAITTASGKVVEYGGELVQEYTEKRTCGRCLKAKVVSFLNNTNLAGTKVLVNTCPIDLQPAECGLMFKCEGHQCSADKVIKKWKDIYGTQ